MQKHQQLVEKLFYGKERSWHALNGGDINDVYKIIDYKGRDFVLKVNEREAFPDMLLKEADGLEELNKYSGLEVPTVMKVDVHENYQFLLMECVEVGKVTPKFWSKFGAGLAKQHKRTASFFGYTEDNYIGSLHQSNQEHTSWTNFFIEERIIPQVKRAVDQGIISLNESKRIEAICPFINELWPEEKPSLLHGDLWSGNYLVGQDNVPYLIDPAVYYGHREIDIGMMHLFGGFDASLFHVYNATFPLEKGWEKRIKYNKIYPLLVHLNLFGRSYFEQLRAIIEPFN